MADEEIYDWDSPIGNEANDDPFVVLPAGEYRFEVTALERGRYEGNPEKGIKACPMAKLTIKADGGDAGEAYVKESIFLNKRNAWKIKALFVSVGLVAADAEEFVPQWNGIVGCAGTCELKIRQFKAKNGDMVDSNDVKRFLPLSRPPAQAAAAAPAFSFPGA